MKQRMNALAAVGLTLAMLVNGSAFAVASEAPAVQSQDPDDIEWVVKYEEKFDSPVAEPDNWVEDTYEEQDDPVFGENGTAIQHRSVMLAGSAGLETFQNNLNSFSSFRKSYSFGEDNWLTLETYGRGADSDTPPETGGHFIINGDGKAVMVCESNTDAALIGSTKPLPSTYRIEVTVSNIDVGGKALDANGREVADKSAAGWTLPNDNDYVDYGGDRLNGYYQSSVNPKLDAGPWRTDDGRSGSNAMSQNGMYFLGIVDYGNPKPHNNIFIHHHRKAAFDTDNNPTFNLSNGAAAGDSWSYVYDEAGNKKPDGSRYIAMLWVDGEYTGPLQNQIDAGSPFYSYTSKGPEKNSTTMVDKYMPGESYTFAIERTPESYTLEVTGNFYYGGHTTYRHTKKHLPEDENFNTWTYHFNQTVEELQGMIPPTTDHQYMGQTDVSWPSDAVYPDYFYLGIPHINYYAGTAEFSNLTLYVPKGSADDPEMNKEATLKLSGVTVADKTYDGKSVVADISGLSVSQLDDGTDLTAALKDDVTYTWYNTADPDRALSIVPKNAGNYILKVRIDTIKDTLYRGELNVPFTISKATVDITAEDKTVNAGQAEPAYTYTVTGLAAGEKLAQEPTAKGQNVHMSVGGEYEILVSGGVLPRKTAENYNEIVYHAGKLTVSSTNSGGNGGSTGGSVKNPDGSTVTTVTDKTTGIVTETVTKKDGSKSVIVTRPDGSGTATVIYPSGVKAEAETTAAGVTTATVTLPKGKDAATVTIPMKEAAPGIVAVLVKDDGTEELVKSSVVMEDGVAVPVTGDAKLKLVDNSKQFNDVAEDNWAADAVAFMSSREFFEGTGSKHFYPAAPMTRAMLITVLARLDGSDTNGGATWYEKGIAWAAAKGVSNGENPEDNITREELAIMLYRYADKPETQGNLEAFSDAGSVNAYAETPLRWAVEQGIINGKDGKILDPQGSASRAEVAAMLERFVKAMV